jgi:AraC family transcriptional regulator of arabinose operon
MECLSYPAAQRAVKNEMRRVAEACRDLSPLALEFSLNAMERVLLHVHASSLDHSARRKDERILKAIRLLVSRLREPFSISALAAACGMSPSHFAHLFREETGTTPQRMFEEIRMRRASQLLLSTGLNIGEIAQDLGYENPFYFSRRFSKFWRVSPSAYRAQVRGRGRLTKP